MVITKSPRVVHDVIQIETRAPREHARTEYIPTRVQKVRENVSLGFALAKGLIRGLRDRYPDPSPENYTH